jgi:hypothetical protein
MKPTAHIGIHNVGRFPARNVKWVLDEKYSRDNRLKTFPVNRDDGLARRGHRRRRRYRCHLAPHWARQARETAAFEEQDPFISQARETAAFEEQDPFISRRQGPGTSHPSRTRPNYAIIEKVTFIQVGELDKHQVSSRLKIQPSRIFVPLRKKGMQAANVKTAPKLRKCRRET